MLVGVGGINYIYMVMKYDAYVEASDNLEEIQQVLLKDRLQVVLLLTSGNL